MNTTLLILLLSLGHMVVDLSQGALPVFLPLLAQEFNLTYLQIGFITLFFTFSSAVIQPLFGLASDKYPLSWLMPLGLFLSGFGLALVGWVNSFSFLLVVALLSGLGVAAYHPEGSKTTHNLSVQHRQGTSMAIFAVGGNLGVGLGPMMALWLVGNGDLKGSWGMAVPGAILALLFLLVVMRLASQRTSEDTKNTIQAETTPVRNTNVRVLSILIAFVILRSWVHAGLLSFIPLYFQNFQGVSPDHAAFLLTSFLIAGAAGTILGGPVADRWGMKTGLVGSMILAAATIFPFFHLTGIWTPFLAVLSGAALISTFSTTVVFGQRLMPGKIGVASGVMLGFSVGAGSLGVVLLGAMADTWGLPFTMNIVSFLPLLGLLLALLLPDMRFSTQKA